MAAKISIRGAREHNLQDVDIDLPRDRLIVLTGLSGSGKSSLAFDTIYAEGQRRYVESLSAYARQFLELMEKPDVDSIDGLSPAISIEQKTTSRNPRSTVGTVTEIYDYMRLLFARAGIAYSPATGLPIESQTVSQMVDRLMMMEENTRIYLLAPVVRGRKGEYRKELGDFRQRGFQRVKIDGKVYEIGDAPPLDKNRRHNIEIIVDRVVIREGIESRLADSLETALQLTEGLAFAENADTKEQTVFSARFVCPVSGFTLDEIEPRLFSFNNPHGACPACDGLGTHLEFDEDLVVPNPALSLAEGTIEPWSKNNSPYYRQALAGIAKHYGADMKTPFMDFPAKVQQAILQGSNGEKITITYNDGQRQYTTNQPFEGVIPNMRRQFEEARKTWMQEEMRRFQSLHPCDACGGHRLKPETLAVKLAGLHIGEVAQMSIDEAREWFTELPTALNNKQKEISTRILKEINERLGFLCNVGLEYLTLQRSSRTLSGGESQRIRLASQIGSGLAGVLYVLDEPSIGLHPRDNVRLLETLQRLRDLGNTVIVVEHDEEAIRAADYIIDLGPGAGIHGGRVVARGSLKQVISARQSLTGLYLSGKREIPIPRQRRQRSRNMEISIKGARANNLKNINVDIPLGLFTCVTGVSGSGKSTLVVETLYPALSRHLHRARAVPGEFTALHGVEHLDKVIDIDQSPIGRTPRSNPATYTGIFTVIRDWFAGLPESRARGYAPGRFSFNVKGGRCESCQGDGVIKIEMHFLPDIYVECDTCKGQRYNRETLEIKFRDHSIADVLALTVEEGWKFFKAVPAIRGKLATLEKVGLGYIRIGQPATTLSGGEAQRIKLSKELSRKATGRTLYILDEPTTGLHFEDIRKLLEVLHALVEQGNTMVVIEHNMEVVKTADHIIDLGPEGGDEAGGAVVVTGTPEEVATHTGSHTGAFLATTGIGQRTAGHKESA